jgi:nucleotidyltransferase substrate binding protein (TIGR01987 family)
MERTEAVKTFEQALRRLQEVLVEPESALVRDAAIKRFEFTYELAWKAVQRVLREQGVLCHSPKGCLSEAFTCGLVQDSPLWIRMIEDRNLTVHTYNERMAVAIYRNLKEYEPLFEELLQNLLRALELP